MDNEQPIERRFDNELHYYMSKPKYIDAFYEIKSGIKSEKKKQNLHGFS